MTDHSTTLQKHQNDLIKDEVRELMNYRPHWLIRKGNTLFLLLGACLLALSWIIHIPDIIYTSINLTTSASAMHTGTLLVNHEQGQKIKPGQCIILKFKETPLQKTTKTSGRLRSIAKQNGNNDSLLVTISLENNTPLNAFANKNQLVRAEIIAGNQRLLDRLIAHFKKVWNL